MIREPEAGEHGNMACESNGDKSDESLDCGAFKRSVPAGQTSPVPTLTALPQVVERRRNYSQPWRLPAGTIPQLYLSMNDIETTTMRLRLWSLSSRLGKVLISPNQSTSIHIRQVHPHAGRYRRVKVIAIDPL